MSALIYTGRWTDWSYGSVFGDRITLSSGSGNILITAIALFSAFVGGVAWNIVAFVFHQYRATARPRDGLYHQHQALLRNVADPISYTWNILYAGWHWRHRAPRAIWRSLALSVPALITGVVFSVAGILISQLSSTGNVLLQNTGCGSVSYDPNNITNDQILALEGAYLAAAAELGKVGSAYAQTCYSNSFDNVTEAAYDQYSSSSNCGYFVQPNLTYSYSFEGKCPFRDWCSVPDSEVVTLDTGLLDSLTHLGQNEPPENRVLFRRKQTCSPVRPNNSVITTNIEYTYLADLGNLSIWSYGFFDNQPSMFLQFGRTPSINTTFIYSEAMDFAMDNPYYLMAASTLDLDFGTEESSFYPSPDFIDNISAPLSLFFLANRMSYWNPFPDPWFNATAQQELATGGVGAEETYVYYNPHPGAVLACLEQGQFCNPNAPGGIACTDLDSWYSWNGNPSALNAISLNEAQIQIAWNIQAAFGVSTALSVTTLAGGASLVASNYVYSQSQFFSPALSDHQWQVEVSNWFGLGLSSLQHQYLSGSRQPTIKELLPFWHAYSDGSIALKVCGSQKVKNASYQSFSVLALGLCFAIGGLIVLAGCSITDILPERFGRKKDNLRRQQWLASGTLQLQRVAYQGIGLGEWEGDDGSVPVTKRGQKFEIPTLAPEADSGTSHKMKPGRAKATRLASSLFHKPLNSDYASTELLNLEPVARGRDHFEEDAEQEDSSYYGGPSPYMDHTGNLGYHDP